MFLLPDINLKLRPKILDLKPGTRVVSNTFTMEELEANESLRHRQLHATVHGPALGSFRQKSPGVGNFLKGN
jgi:hypothetical protein